MKKPLDIKERGGTYLKIGWLFAIIIAIVVFILIPETTPRPYRPRVEHQLKMIELPPEMKQLKEPPPIAKPKMPVAAEKGEKVEEATIEKTDFTGFEKAPPPPSTETPDFVPYDTAPEPLYITKPKYPELGRKAGMEGTVILKLLVDTTGYVINVKVVKSLNPAFDESAVKAAKTWRFSPAKQRDKPVRVWLSYPVRFTLKD
jgi:protein TonB